MAKRKKSRPVKKRSVALNGETIHSAVKWAVDGGILKVVHLHGNTSWLVLDLVVLAVMWVWSESETLTGAFDIARRWSLNVLGRVAVDTYQGLMGALVSNTGKLLPVIWQRLHQLMEKVGGAHWKIGRWVPIAVDGSRTTTPRTKENEAAFCAPNYGQSQMAKWRRQQLKKRGSKPRKNKQEPVKPQIWVTLLWHMVLQIPWSWKSGPSNSSEREHLRQIMAEQKLPKNTLLCTDAGFTGYELWQEIIDRGYSFLTRVGGNVTLLRNLGFHVRERDGIVYCWPQNVASKKEQPPLVLRLIRVRLGTGDAYLLTNILEEKQLTENQALKLYRLRWGIELQFRTLKQTFGRRKLRCKTPDRALVELDWSLVGLTIIQLFAIKEQIEIGEIPDRCSISLAIRIVRETIHRWSEKPEKGDSLQARLRGAVKDNYKRTSSKTARYKPNYKEKPRAGMPEIVKATRKHKQWLRNYLASAA